MLFEIKELSIKITVTKAYLQFVTLAKTKATLERYIMNKYNFKRSYLLILILVFIFSSIIISGCGEKAVTPTQGLDIISDTISVPADSIIALDSSYHFLSEWIGVKPVVILFGGTWCPPCIEEVPDLKLLYTEYHSQGIEIVSLWVRDNHASVSNFVDRQNIDWVNLIDYNNVIATHYQVQGVPTALFIDIDGNQSSRLLGRHNYNYLKDEFEKIL